MWVVLIYVPFRLGKYYNILKLLKPASIPLSGLTGTENCLKQKISKITVSFGGAN